MTLRPCVCVCVVWGARGGGGDTTVRPGATASGRARPIDRDVVCSFLQIQRETAARLRAENKQLKDIQSLDEVDLLQRELADAREAEAAVTEVLQESLAEKMDAVMRAEAAESQHKAVTAELIESTKK